VIMGIAWNGAWGQHQEFNLDWTYWRRIDRIITNSRFMYAFLDDRIRIVSIFRDIF
jgi:hypothetical protein